MSPSWATFLFELANFLLLAAVLGWAFFRPVRDALERRRAAIAAELEEARRAREEAERLLAEARAKLARQESELAELRRRMREEVARERERLLEEVRKRAEQEREALAAQLEGMRQAMARRVARDAARVVRDLVVHLLERIGGPDLEQGLRAHAARELEQLAARGSLTPLQVESAVPLSEAAIRKLADAARADPQEIRVTVRPELVAGVRVVTARGLVDASAAGIAEVVAADLLQELGREGASHA